MPIKQQWLNHSTFIPIYLIKEIQNAAKDSGASRLALVGGVVRDGLLATIHNYPFSNPPDIDLLVEGSVSKLVKQIQIQLTNNRISQITLQSGFDTA